MEDEKQAKVWATTFGEWNTPIAATRFYQGYMCSNREKTTNTMRVYTLNHLLEQIVERNENDFSPDKWKKKLSKAPEYFEDKFWLFSNEDGDRKYGTSMWSFKILMEEILEKL